MIQLYVKIDILGRYKKTRLDMFAEESVVCNLLNSIAQTNNMTAARKP